MRSGGASCNTAVGARATAGLGTRSAGLCARNDETANETYARCIPRAWRQFVCGVRPWSPAAFTAE